MSNNKASAFILGATASGKSALALRLADDLSGEIVSADSMQLYKGLDIGTAKSSAEELAAVPHHLISLYDINEKLDVYRFVKLAKAAIADIHSRGKLPFIVGGTGFYVKALIYGLDELPGDAKLRAELDAKYDKPEAFEALKEVMRERDPVDFERWQQHQRKLIRALEVFTLTGKSITELQTIEQQKAKGNLISWNLCWDRELLKERIAKRTDIMLSSGWIEETQNAIEDGILDSPTAHQALGYKVIAQYLKDEMTYDEMRSRIATNTWQLARRQISWFKNQQPETNDIHMPIEYEVLKDKFARELAALQAQAN